MLFKRLNNKYIIRLERGEEIVESLKKLCKNEKIQLGRITGLGAVSNVEIGYFELKKKEYHSKRISGDLEILNLNGNITSMNGDIYLHLHITISDEELHAFGGHLNSATISATGEIIIDVIEGEVDRYFNDETGLNLLSL